VLADIDAFWAEEFAARGVSYYAAEIVPVSETMTTNCGPFGPYDNPAAFCPLEDAIYYSVPLSSDVTAQVGDFAWITVLAHEWGHHVQLLMNIDPGDVDGAGAAGGLLCRRLRPASPPERVFCRKVTFPKPS
jgi:predicted metalloprotease